MQMHRTQGLNTMSFARRRNALAAVNIGISPSTSILTLIVACASVFSLIAVVQAKTGLTVMSASTFDAAHMSLEIFAISVSFSIFSMRWSTGRMVADRQSIMIGSAFIAVGLLGFFHVLSYPGMTTSLPHSTHEISSYMFIFERLAMVVPLLFVALMPLGRAATPSDSYLSVLTAITLSASLLVLTVLSVDALPALHSEGLGATWLERAFEYTIIGLFIAGSIKYWQLWSNRRDPIYSYLAASMTVGVFGGLSFTLYANPFDLINLMGHFFIFFSFLFVLLALLRESVIVPYQRLHVTKKKLGTERKALMQVYRKLDIRTKDAEKAKARSDTYFDFLSHDISNMLSPVVVYADMLATNNRMPPECRNMVMSLARESRRAGSFITSIKKLAAAEATAPGDVPRADLTSSLRHAEEMLRRSYPEKNLFIDYGSSLDSPIVTVGGEHVESIISNLLRSTLENASTDTIKISIDAKILNDDRGDKFWRINISQIGWPITFDSLEDANKKIDSTMRFKRTVGSDIPIYHSIIDHFGGRFRIETIEDEVPIGGFRFVVDLPMAEGVRLASGPAL